MVWGLAQPFAPRLVRKTTGSDRDCALYIWTQRHLVAITFARLGRPWSGLIAAPFNDAENHGNDAVVFVLAALIPASRRGRKP
jgi:hypothetical protein